MTSMLPARDSGAMSLKRKLMPDSPVKEEIKSFLSVSRENLNISHSDLEQGFNRPRARQCRNSILSAVAFTLALFCFGLEIWKLHYSIANAREIEQLKRDVEDLKHWFLEQSTVDVLKTVDEQLYGEPAEESTEDDDPGEADIDNADYDSDYEDDSTEWYDSSDDYSTPLANYSKTNSTRVQNNSKDSKDNRLLDYLMPSLMHSGFQDSTTLSPDIEYNRTLEILKFLRNRDKHEYNSTKRDILTRDVTKKEGGKLKRSLTDRAIADYSMDSSNYRRNGRHRTRGAIVSRMQSHTSDESKVDDSAETNSTPSTVSWDGHPPKKYHAHARPEASGPAHDSQLSEEIARLNRRTNDETEGDSWRNVHRNATGRRAEIRRLVQVYAVHYEADSTLFSNEDEHTGNGRARHGNGVFKAWRPSDWVAELGMSRHFTLAADGRLTVHEPGLYLAYAQIHYLDEHDENGFHLLVNGRPILQCMIYSPGSGHKSRSCFSAQVTFLQAGDHLVLKDVGSARYTLFQHDKSFFGLVKLGEPRQQQRHQS